MSILRSQPVDAYLPLKLLKKHFIYTLVSKYYF